MPSGITHVLLSQGLIDKLQADEKSEKIAETLSAALPFFSLGSVGPDLPYASFIDGDFFFSRESEVADDFHYRKTNELPIRALQHIRNTYQSGTDDIEALRKKDAMFCFFVGFCSHVIADSIVHPFVRDKVGEYKPNASDHRTLEMKLDVLLYKHLTASTGEFTEFNYSDLHTDFKEVQSRPYFADAMDLFAQLIRDVYGRSIDGKTTAGWSTGIYRLFELADGDHPKIYRIEATESLLYRNVVDLDEEKEKCLILNEPRYWSPNFHGGKPVHFFVDCLPRYYKKMTEFITRAYVSVYEDGDPITAADLPAINLDNGRLLTEQGNSSESLPDTTTINASIPYYWRS